MLSASFAPYLLKLLMPKIMDHFMEMFKLDKVLQYVEQPNDADIRIDKVETQIKMLAEDQHPPIFTEEMKKKIVDRLDRLEEFEQQVRRKKAFKRKDG
tara:strand:- start:30 stop:323 length:294 start_codon:yes stop_codon:yes gene_type:complete